MIHTETREIRNILPETGTARITVPLYQRNFEWGKNEAEDLWNDIISSESGIFLGTIVFDVSKKASGEIAIVDGQQRLTTIFLFLVACRALARQRENSELEAAINRKIAYCDDTTGTTTSTKLVASPSIRDVFEFVVDGHWDETFPVKIGSKHVKRQSNKIRPVYEYFKSKLDGIKSDELSEVLRKLYSTFAVVIEIDHDVEVFDLFERTNARGLELNAADLLKNHLFSANSVDSLEEIWEEIIDNSQGTILRMLKYFWVSRRGYIQKKELYPKLKQYSREVGAEALASELRDFANFYYIVRNGSEDEFRQYLSDKGEHIISGKEYNYQAFYGNLEALRLFRITQIYPILYSALHCYIKSGKDDDRLAKQMLKLMATLENYHFVNNAVCQRIGNEVEKLYADACDEFSRSTDFRKSASDLIERLRKNRADKSEFISRFSEIVYSQDSIPLISYIFDRFGNFHRTGGQILKLFSPDKRFFRRNWNIEHFFPKSKAGLLENFDDVDSVGNLLVISLHTNSALQDKDPRDKIPILQAKELHNPHVADFLTNFSDSVLKTGWSSLDIRNRTINLSEKGYSEIWVI